ncbi:hypothetical protein BQ8482_300038 [Mesorhizobium delmotii]|uniref:Uncharacterized protein n=1 Tax=Mesorhizobium delmotii TaxID=1631247 RepID=A0A2P9AND6_9HYPH|nr:hypothetical protein BQ8482_300038 [Mesorhizobium delmotii]
MACETHWGFTTGNQIERRSISAKALGGSIIIQEVTLTAFPRTCRLMSEYATRSRRARLPVPRMYRQSDKRTCAQIGRDRSEPSLRSTLRRVRTPTWYGASLRQERLMNAAVQSLARPWKRTPNAQDDTRHDFHRERTNYSSEIASLPLTAKPRHHMYAAPRRPKNQFHR